MGQGSAAPWSFFLIRLLFKTVLKVFYGSIIIEGVETISPNGQPCVVCANHSNSLTDAVLLVASMPSHKRNLLRMTAKSSLFGIPWNFSSWLIEAAGTVPMKRRQDFAEGAEVDNSQVMAKLMEALELGDAICMFPEGISRFHPTVAPLKTGVARIISDVLTRNRENPEFEIWLQTCSITYMHRQHWRSDVLVTYHPPIRYTPKDNPELLAPVEHETIRELTAEMAALISSGTIDAPSWDLVATAKTAARIYAPLGTRMSLGDYVRLVAAFVKVFQKEDVPDSSIHDTRLALNAYQKQLARWQIKDERVRRPLARPIIMQRLITRLLWSLFLFTISLPGLIFWLPVFFTTSRAVKKLKKTGPVWNVWDEVAQYKVLYGLGTGVVVWFLAVLVTWPIAPITFFAVPVIMWITLRWIEDAISAFRAFATLVRLLRVGKPALSEMRSKRVALHSRVCEIAVDTMNLPADPETHFVTAGGREKGRVRGRWESVARYFSLKRRRKKDWNEMLRLYDKVDYPADDE